MRCPHCRMTLARVAGSPGTVWCVRCEQGYSALSERQSEALDVIRGLGEAASAQAIGDALGISRQAASKLCSSLERLGVIRDEPVLVRSGKWRVVGQ